jgi:hypothetical protein
LRTVPVWSLAAAQAPRLQTIPRRPHEQDDRRRHRRLRAGTRRPRGGAGETHRLRVKGFYKAEDDALFAAIKKFEAKHPKVKIELSQYPVQDMIPKTVAALDSEQPARRRVCRRSRLPRSPRNGRSRASRGHQQRDRSDSHALCAEHRRDHALYDDKVKTRAYYAFS